MSRIKGLRVFQAIGPSLVAQTFFVNGEFGYNGVGGESLACASAVSSEEKRQSQTIAWGCHSCSSIPIKQRNPAHILVMIYFTWHIYSIRCYYVTCLFHSVWFSSVCVVTVATKVHLFLFTWPWHIQILKFTHLLLCTTLWKSHRCSEWWHMNGFACLVYKLQITCTRYQDDPFSKHVRSMTFSFCILLAGVLWFYCGNKIPMQKMSPCLMHTIPHVCFQWCQFYLLCDIIVYSNCITSNNATQMQRE